MKTSEPGPLLTAAGLQVQFQTKDGPRQVLHGVDYHIDRGEIVGIIGETGSGKSMSLRAALGMLPRSASLTAGTALFQGRDLLRMSAKELRSIKGEEIGFVPQQPWSALNPILTLEKQFIAIGSSHGRSKDWTKAEARDMLRRLEIPSVDRVLRGYVGELSGGMAQRVLIAMSLLLSPSLVVADEPTTALDLTVQREVLDMLTAICRASGTGVLLVTHDLGVVSTYCDRVYVMNHGEVLENGTVEQTLGNPRESYTRDLVMASSRHMKSDDYGATAGNHELEEVTHA